MTRLIVAALVVALSFGPIWAGVQYTETTDFKLSGPLGTVVNVMAKLGGASTKVERKVYIQGEQMRTDEGKKRTMLTHIGKRQTVHINHEDRTYTIVPLACCGTPLTRRLQ